MYSLLKEDYLHFKVKAYLMDGASHFSNPHLKKPVTLWLRYWACSKGQFLQTPAAHIQTYTDLKKNPGCLFKL